MSAPTATSNNNINISISSFSAADLAPQGSTNSPQPPCPQQQLPTVILTCQPNSHPFQTRTIQVSAEVVKVGRAVARLRAMTSNAIFDCKVLSRNHAILWFENTKFWLRDTKSSNGTFVNNQRLSKGSEESPAREIYSGDIIQFGVEVMENSVTHGCIIAQFTLYHADGSEARRTEDCSKLPNGGLGYTSVNEEQVYQLSQYLQEALHREQALERKLEALQKLLGETQEASYNGWQALLNEDRLLEKLDLLETQLQVFAKNFPDDNLRAQLSQALEVRFNLERSSKVMLDKVLAEKTDALRKVTDLEMCLSNSESECSRLRSVCEGVQDEYTSLSSTYQQKLLEMDRLETRLQELQSAYTAELDQVQAEKAALVARLEEMTQEEQNLQVQLERLEAHKDFTEAQLDRMKERLSELTGHQPNLLDDALSPAKAEAVAEMVAAVGGSDEVPDGREQDRDMQEAPVRHDQCSNPKSEPGSDGNEGATAITPDRPLSSHGDTKEIIEGLVDSREQYRLELRGQLEETRDQLNKADVAYTAELDRICLLQDQIALSESRMAAMLESAVSGLSGQLKESVYQIRQTQQLTGLIEDDIAWLETQLTVGDSSHLLRSVSPQNLDSDEREEAELQEELATLPKPDDESGATGQRRTSLDRVRHLLRKIVQAQNNTETTLYKYQVQLVDLIKLREQWNLQLEEVDAVHEHETTASANPAPADQLTVSSSQLEERETQTTSDSDPSVDSPLVAELARVQTELNALQQKLSAVTSCSAHADAVIQTTTERKRDEPESDSPVSALTLECTCLRDRLASVEAEMTKARSSHELLAAEYERLQADVQQKEVQASMQLAAAERRVVELESNCALHRSELDHLRVDVAADYRNLASRSRVVSAIAVIPIMVVIFAVMVTIYTSLTAMTGGR